MTGPKSLFVVDGESIVATEFSRGPWDPGSCHGGPVAALLAWTCERIDGVEAQPWHLGRITVELVRPVPVLQPLFVTAEIERPGRRVSLVGARLTLESGKEVARARALRIRRSDVALPAEYELEPPFGEPGVGTVEQSPFSVGHIAFHNSVDLRFARGSWSSGQISLWCRLRYPVIPGEEPSGAQRAVATADFSNGVSAELDSREFTFINPDLSVHLVREPQGEWIGMQARSHYGPEGAGLAEGALFDSVGRCGRSTQSLMITRR